MNTAYAYKKIDAFTAGSSLGNPAACIYLAADQRLDEEAMLEIARAHKGFVSEMVYCAEREGTIHLRYFSSECEVDFCGHGTIACMYGLIKERPVLLTQREIPIQTLKKGVLTVYNRIPEQDIVLISAPEPLYLETALGTPALAEALGIAPEAVDASLPVDLIDAGLRTLIVPLADLAVETGVMPDEARLKLFCEDNGIDIILIFTRAVADPGHIAHTRVFAPRFGYLEDPATGSGNSAFAYYMRNNALWDGSDCRVEQGGRDRVYNAVHLSCKDGAVLFGGGATVRIEGMYWYDTSGK